MKIVIIQKAGEHEKNKDFRESLNLHRALSRIEGVESKVWGVDFSEFSIPFSEIEKWADVIFIMENYFKISYINFNNPVVQSDEWIPTLEISRSKKLKIFWSIDSHRELQNHKIFCKILNIDILLNSTEGYLKDYNGFVKESHWFPNSYPDDLMFPKKLEKNIDIGFCGNVINRGPLINYLGKYGIKKDIFVIGDDMVNAINSYKIHFNRNISNDINYRTFETTGCGTLLFTNYTSGLEKLFNIGEEIVVYNDLKDLDVKVKYYLENDEERERIANAGYERAKKDHTYYERAKTLVSIIKNRIKNENI